VANIEKMTADLKHATLIRFKRQIAATQELDLAKNMAARATDRIAKAETALRESAPDLEEKFEVLARFTGKDQDELRAELTEEATKALAARKAKGAKGEADGDTESTDETPEATPAGDVAEAVSEDAEPVSEAPAEEVQPEVSAKPARRGGRFARAE
jgi:hypothetical protein